MLYLGIDMHSKWFTLAGFDKETGEVFNVKKTSNSPEAIQAVFATLPAGRRGAMEAGTNAVAMYRRLAPYFEQLCIVAPHKVWDRRQQRAAKTDQRDAWGLAERLADNKLTPLFVPTDDLRAWRTLARARMQTTQDVTQQTNRLYALARSWGYLDEKKLLTKGGRAWLDTVALPAYAQQVFTESLTSLEALQARETAYERVLCQLAQEDPICQ